MIEIILFSSMLITVGLLVGAFAASIGLGGGIIIMPFLLLVLQIEPANAVGISLFAITATTASASIGYIRQKKVDFRLALLYDIFDIPGVIIGAIFTTILPGWLLATICGLVLCTLSILIIRKGWSNKLCETEPSKVSNLENKNGLVENIPPKNDYYSPRNLVFASCSSFIGGVMTGLIGMSGGVTDTTSMILLGVPAVTAVATSEVAMLLTNFVGMFMQGLIGHLRFDIAIPLAIGTFIGAQFGCKLSGKISTKYIRMLLGSISLIMGLQLLVTILF
ncbi:MAG: sulfite exporter TauE/SafE family protein [Candidatus Ranarchaeia archaeon]